MSAMTTTASDVLNPQGRRMVAEEGTYKETASAEEANRSLYQRGKEKLIKGEEGFETMVRAHPVRSVLIAAGVGLAIGVILGRRR